MKDFNLTELEKSVLKDALADGYTYDGTYDPNAKAHFLTWGFVGKRERGAAASLVKKNIISVDYDRGDTLVYLLISREEAEELVKK